MSQQTSAADREITDRLLRIESDVSKQRSPRPPARSQSPSSDRRCAPPRTTALVSRRRGIGRSQGRRCVGPRVFVVAESRALRMDASSEVVRRHSSGAGEAIGMDHGPAATGPRAASALPRAPLTSSHNPLVRNMCPICDAVRTDRLSDVDTTGRLGATFGERSASATSPSAQERDDQSARLRARRSSKELRTPGRSQSWRSTLARAGEYAPRSNRPTSSRRSQQPTMAWSPQDSSAWRWPKGECDRASASGGGTVAVDEGRAGRRARREHGWASVGVSAKRDVAAVSALVWVVVGLPALKHDWGHH